MSITGKKKIPLDNLFFFVEYLEEFMKGDFFMKKIFIFIFMFFPIYALTKYKVTKLYNPILYGNPYCYDASILCADSGPTSCPSGKYLAFSQCGSCSPNPTDGIGKHTRNPLTGQWTYNGILWNCYNYPCGVIDEKYKNDGFGGPDVIKDSGNNDRIYLFYSHGNADFFKGRIEFRYGTTSGTYSQPFTILSIADENISDCTCCGGVARVSAVDKGQWFYVYFEVWISNYQYRLEITCPEKIEKPPGSGKYVCEIGHAQVFLFKIKKKSTVPYIELSGPTNQVYNAYVYKKINCRMDTYEL